MTQKTKTNTMVTAVTIAICLIVKERLTRKMNLQKRETQVNQLLPRCFQSIPYRDVFKRV